MAIQRYKYNDYKIGDSGHPPWGYWQVVTVGDGFINKILNVTPGGSMSLHLHEKRIDIWVIISGQGLVQLEQSRMQLKQHEVLYIAPGQPHRVTNQTQHPLTILETQMGNYLSESDLLRLEDKYGRLIS